MLFRIIATSLERGQHARGRGAAWSRRASVAAGRPGARGEVPLLSGGAGLADDAPARRSRRCPSSMRCGEFITRRMLQAVTGEMAVKAAMDAAAKETTDFLKGRGIQALSGTSPAPPRRPIGLPACMPSGACGCSWCRAPSCWRSCCFYPLGYAIYLSLFNYYLGSGEPSFIGLGNYAALLADERFWGSLGNARCSSCWLGGRRWSSCSGLAVAYGLYRLTFGVRTPEPAAVPAAHRDAGRGGAVPALDLHRPLGPAGRHRDRARASSRRTGWARPAGRGSSWCWPMPGSSRPS